MPKRSTVALCNFVSKILSSTKESYQSIDVGCGAGGNIYHLSNVLPNTKWVGLDFADKFFDMGRRYLPDKAKYDFVKGDFYKLGKMFPSKTFDLSFSIQTLTWLPGYEEAMKEILYVTKGWVFITSLFSDFNVDVLSEVFEYEVDWHAKEDSPYNYNVYSIGKFRDFCIHCGAKEVIAEDFVIDIDLSVPSNKLMGTYTIKDSGRARLQFSGPVFMPWKMIAVEMD